jgi:hypothetical protein
MKLIVRCRIIGHPYDHLGPQRPPQFRMLPKPIRIKASVDLKRIVGNDLYIDIEIAFQLVQKLILRYGFARYMIKTR